ncbi:hypothetical protein IQ270_14190 [Microcoleus sp. LEGE 07076]|uniref:hypothetical protein n=1 Tax=Microcoleus sp. LEGE 07076 TaxID=915322 RepID=UPI0018805259|nr:hypothetical protein [Microcoleus sp. LEGE 07076]MBE9185816.1 hypothetical protein [Microcoleus sp. LEGE 07076]
MPCLFEVATAATNGWAWALHQYLYSRQRDFAALGDRSPYRRSVNKPIGLDC